MYRRMAYKVCEMGYITTCKPSFLKKKEPMSSLCHPRFSARSFERGRAVARCSKEKKRLLPCFRDSVGHLDAGKKECSSRHREVVDVLCSRIGRGKRVENQR